MKDPYALISLVYDRIIEPFLASFKTTTADILCRHRHPDTRIRVLDAACGTGTQARLLAHRGFVVCGLEKAPGMIARAVRKVPSGGPGPGRLLFVQGDLGNIPLAPATFDAVIVQMTLHELAPEVRRRCITEIKRVAKANAVFICVDFVPASKRTLSGLLILLAELAAGKSHYRNGRQFVGSGGLLPFMAQNGFEVSRRHLFMQGGLCLAVAAKQPIDGASEA